MRATSVWWLVASGWWLLNNLEARSRVAVTGTEVFSLATGHQPPTTVNAVVYNGWKTFEANCARCHGRDALGSSLAPALVRSVSPGGTVDHRAFFETVTQGRPTKGTPTWGNALSPEQKEDLWSYLRARAVDGLAPGRLSLAAHANPDSTVLPKALGQDTTWPGPPPNS